MPLQDLLPQSSDDTPDTGEIKMDMDPVSPTSKENTGAGIAEDEEDLKDEFCDPDNPVVVKFQDVSAAAYKIKSGIQRTPCQV